MLPLVLEYRYINVAQWTQNYYNYQDHFVEFFQLFSPFWGFGISNPGPHDGLSFQLGIIPFILALFALPALVKNPRGLRPFALFFVLLTLVIVPVVYSLIDGFRNRFFRPAVDTDTAPEAATPAHPHAVNE